MSVTGVQEIQEIVVDSANKDYFLLEFDTQTTSKYKIIRNYQKKWIIAFKLC